MNKTSPIVRYGTKLSVGLAALVFFTTCINGCATPAQTGNSKDQSSASSDKDNNQLVGPDYYQSSDNPYHSD